jgi:V8-like Glu-specific endopeptidase
MSTMYELEDEFETEFEVIGLVDSRVRVFPAPRNPSTRLFPFNTICYLDWFEHGHSQPVGTGTLVAPRVVLTAGHVVRASATKSLRVTPGAALDAARPANRSAGRPPSQLVSPSRFRTPAGFVGGTATDYGILLLPRSFTRPARFMPLQARAASRSSIAVTIAGFPGEHNLIHPGTMYRDTDRIEAVATADGLLRYPVDTSPGNSGSPVWLLGSGETRIQIGVHISGRANDPVHTRNVGVRITNTVLTQIGTWCRAARVRPPQMWRSR